jgi:hypothetical protein
MSPLQRGALLSLLALGRKLGTSVPEIKVEAEIKGAEAVEMIGDLFGHLFPGLRPGQGTATP